MPKRRKPRPDRARALSRPEVGQLLTRTDFILRERTLRWMLYETAARSAGVPALDVEDLDLGLGRTRLSWLGTGPVAATPASVKGELEKLAFLAGCTPSPPGMAVRPQPVRDQGLDFPGPAWVVRSGPRRGRDRDASGWRGPPRPG
jgi:hypothetical protein